jgi:hypothetical protein
MQKESQTSTKIETKIAKGSQVNAAIQSSDKAMAMFSPPTSKKLHLKLANGKKMIIKEISGNVVQNS